MPNPPLVSIVVPSRTGQVDALRAQLNRQSLKDWELIVDTDPSTPGQARNLGAARASGKWLVFFDDDVGLPSDELLASLIRALESVGENTCVGVPCRIIPEASYFQRQLFRESFHLNGLDSSNGLLETSWCDSANGRCMALGRETFERLGGFDKQQPSGEEPELLYRLCRQGGKVYLLTDHWVYYAPPETLRVAVKKTIWYERGNAQFAQKHPDAHYRIPLKNRWNAAGYLFLRTLSLFPLCFLKVSYQHRKPSLQWRPAAALLSYLGAWVYCVCWFSQSSGTPSS